MFRPYAFTLIFLAFFSILSAQASWETVRIEDFSNAGSPPSLANISGLAQSGLSLSANGATGALSDLCAGGTWTNGKYLSFQHQLTAAYEYRISCNAKATATNKKLQFAYASSPGTNGSGYTPVGSLHNIAFTATPSTPGTDIVSDVFTISADGTYHITIAADASGSASAVARLDNYKLERRALLQPTRVYFASESLSVQEGESVAVCVNIENPANVATTVEVNLSGDGGHFPGFTPVTLTFPPNSQETQCFELVSVANNRPDTTLVYQLVLQNIMGGFNPEIIMPDEMSLTIEDDLPLPEGCPWAGENKVLCHDSADREGVLIGCPDMEIPGYCYRWAPEDNLTSPHHPFTFARPLSTTTYTLYISDDNGNLIASDEVTVLVPLVASIEAVGIVEGERLCGGETVTLRALGQGSSSSDNFSYLWSNGDTTTEISFIASFNRYTHRITITDLQSGCRSIAEYNIPLDLKPNLNPYVLGGEICELSTPEVRLNEVKTLDNFDCPNTSAILFANTSYASVEFLWSTGDTTEYITVDQTGVYTIQAKFPGSNCITEDSLSVYSCGGDVLLTFIQEDGIEYLNAGDGFSSYLWNTGATSSKIPITGSGFYEVEVVTNGGCIIKGSEYLNLNSPPEPEYELTVVSTYNAFDRSLFICGGSSIDSVARLEIESSLKNKGTRLLRFENRESIIKVSWQCDIYEIKRASIIDQPLTFYNILIYRDTFLKKLYYYIEGTTSGYIEHQFIVNELDTIFPQPSRNNFIDIDTSYISDLDQIKLKSQYKKGSTIVDNPSEVVIFLENYTNPVMDTYALYTDEQIAPDTILITEGDTLLLELRKRLPDGSFILDFPLSYSMWSLNGDPLGEHMNSKLCRLIAPYVGGSSNSILYSIEISLTDENNRLYRLSVVVFIQDRPVNPGIFIVPPSNSTCIRGNAMDYLGYAINSISNSNNTTILQQVLSPLSNKRLEINLVESSSPLYQATFPQGVIGYGWNSINYIVFEKNRFILKNVQRQFNNNCIINADMKLEISKNEYEMILNSINDINNNNVPEVVQRIKQDNYILGGTIESYCINNDQSKVASFRKFFVDAYNAKEVYYSPNDGELNELVRVDDLVKIYMVLDNLCTIHYYTSLCSSNSSTLTWYNNNFANDGDEEAQVNTARNRKYSQTLLHEMAHCSYPLLNKYEAYKWVLIKENTVFSNSCYEPTACSVHSGHEIGNPDGIFTCGIEAFTTPINCIQN